MSSAGGDAFLTACLWKFGIAPTSPDPLWHPDGLSLFDATSALLPDPISQRSIPIKVSRHVGNLLASTVGFCNALCQVGLRFPQRSWVAISIICRASGSKDPACSLTPHLHYCQKNESAPQPHQLCKHVFKLPASIGKFCNAQCHGAASGVLLFQSAAAAPYSRNSHQQAFCIAYLWWHLCPAVAQQLASRFILCMSLMQLLASRSFQSLGCCSQLELNHVASLHLNEGLLKSADVSVDVGQLIGLLRTSRHTGLLMTLNASLLLHG